MNKKINFFVDKPIFIVGAGHSGTSIIHKSISQHPHIASWSENNKTWIWGNAFRDNDVLDKEDLTPGIKEHIVTRYIQYLKKSNKNRICDKTPKNCLRIPFILSVFPDAKIIHVVRDARAVIASTQSQIHKKSYPLLEHLSVKLKGSSVLDWYVFLPRLLFVFKKVTGMSVHNWGSRTQNWKNSNKDKTYIRLAKQWKDTVTYTRSKGLEFGINNYLEVRYEDFIEDPTSAIKKIANFTNIHDIQPILKFCQSNIDSSRNSKRVNSLAKEDLKEIMSIIKPTLSDFGYETDG